MSTNSLLVGIRSRRVISASKSEDSVHTIMR